MSEAILDYKDIWKKSLIDISKQIKKVHFVTWFKDTAFLKVDNRVAVIGVPSVFSRDWLKSKYSTLILDVLKSNFAEIESIAFEVEPALSHIDDPRKLDVKKLSIVSQQEKKPRKVPKMMEVRLIEGITSKLLNPRYRLANFIVGPENRLAHAACTAVAEHPGGSYNPLFVYGGVGLGKTHLLQAIGNEVLAYNSDAVVAYIPSERFVNEIVDAIRNRTTQEFRSKYRKVDILIVDDIQFLAHKEQTQEEFFHTFNELFEANRQIIISSDRPPKDLRELHDRLRSRFEMGMIVDVQFPSYETRLAILLQKCREHQTLVSPEVLEYIAFNVRESVRELEGILLQAIAQSKLENRVPTLKLVADLMAKLDKRSAKSLAPYQHIEPVANTISALIESVSTYYRIPRSELLGEARHKEIMLPRQICMYLARTELNQSYEKIGKDFGGKNHTTVMHACEKIIQKLKIDSKLVKDVSLIKQAMGM